MHALIDHRTHYHYETEASGVIQLLRLTPRSDDAQQILSWRIDVDADGRLIPFTDSHGNMAHAFYADRPIRQLTIHVTGEVMTVDMAGILRGVRDPLDPLIYRRQTALTAPSPGILALARGVDSADRVALAHGLMLAVHAALRFETDVSGSHTDAATALAQGAGVCQDMAQVLIAAARSRGYPARYVSGHYAAPDHPEQEASHAWAELFIEGLGWVGFDPAHGVSATEGHVRVAVGFDAADAAPVRGSRRGGGREQLCVEVHGRLAASARQQQEQPQG